MSAGIGSEGQFAPIRLGVVWSLFWFMIIGVVVAPSMAAVKLAARRVKLNLHLLQVWRGGSTVLLKKDVK